MVNSQKRRRRKKIQNRGENVTETGLTANRVPLTIPKTARRSHTGTLYSEKELLLLAWKNRALCTTVQQGLLYSDWTESSGQDTLYSTVPVPVQWTQCLVLHAAVSLSCRELVDFRLFGVFDSVRSGKKVGGVLSQLFTTEPNSHDRALVWTGELLVVLLH